ncbi:MAG: UPF0158 family protein [Peptoniphilaceae bacterium]|nr:UPF0158 family protein [Peptoniphilaceae bacterium]MDD7383567.1 UPF0158 family protein [Peptoniphilaceae bacterium]MDY3738740.1 UPF0158 family protein [Peptoniphilaceae bacterium]
MSEKIINLSWLIEQWSFWDDPYVKSIRLNTDTFDVIKIMENMDDTSDITSNYLDIENEVEAYHCMPTGNDLDKKYRMNEFAKRQSEKYKEDLFNSLSTLNPISEFEETIYDYGLEQDWNEFKNKVSAKIIYEWAIEEKIEILKDVNFSDLYEYYE